MAIIMDNEEHKRMVIMKDNGYGTTCEMKATRSIFLPFSSTTRTENSSGSSSKTRRRSRQL